MTYFIPILRIVLSYFFEFQFRKCSILGLNIQIFMLLRGWLVSMQSCKAIFLQLCSLQFDYYSAETAVLLLFFSDPFIV